MFQWSAWKRLIPLGVFFSGYTLLFLLWRFTFFYSLPFLLGLLFAMALQPVIRFVEKKLSFSHSAASGVVTVLALLLLFAALILLGCYAVGEITRFLLRAAQGGFPEFSPPVRAFLGRISDFFKNLDGDFWARNQEQLTELLKSSADLILAAMSKLLGLLTSLPTLVTMLLVTAFAAFFIARDFDRLCGWAKALLSRKGLSLISAAAKSSTGTGRRYVLSYVLIYFISFCEAFVILYILGLPYPLLTAAITCVADVLPVLGPGIVFTPLAVYQLLTGEYGRGLGLLIGWLIMTCVRQVIEPKLVASTIRIHPLAMLAAVYFSLAAGSLWVLLYTAGLFMLYSVLRKAEILPAVSAGESGA